MSLKWIVSEKSFSSISPAFFKTTINKSEITRERKREGGVPDPFQEIVREVEKIEKLPGKIVPPLELASNLTVPPRSSIHSKN